MKNEIKNDTINKVVSNAAAAATTKKEIKYADASILLKNRIANKNFKKEFKTLNGARWMLLQEIAKMQQTTTPFTYTVEAAKKIIDNNKEQIMPTKSGTFTVNVLISFINKEIKEQAKKEKEEAKKDLQSSRITKKNAKTLYSGGGLI